MIITKRQSYILAHHGIKGQQWGVQNGPPYPLDKETASAVKYGENPGDKSTSTNSRLSEETIKKFESKGFKILDPSAIDQKELFYSSDKYDDSILNFKRHKSINNCVMVSTSYALNKLGIKNTVSRNNGESHNIDEVVSAFPGAEKSEIKFYSSAADLRKQISEKYPNGAMGIIGAFNSAGFGHAMNWEVSNGKTIFTDTQKASRNEKEIKKNFKLLKVSGDTRTSYFERCSDISDEALECIYDRGGFGADLVRLDTIKDVNTNKSKRILRP